MTDQLADIGVRVDDIRQASRRAATVTALGAIIVGSAFIFGLYRLYRMELRVSQLQTEISELEKEKKVLHDENYLLNTNNELLQRKNKDLSIDNGNLRDSYKQCQRSIELAYARKYEDAITVCDQILARDSRNIIAMAIKGHSLYRLNKFEESLSIANAAIQVDPDYPLPYWTVCLVEFRTGERRQASETLEKMLDRDIDNYNSIRFDPNFSEFKNYPEFVAIMRHQADLIKSIQVGLVRLGYYRGTIDGLIGTKTSIAMQRFCASHGLPFPTVSATRIYETIDQEFGIPAR